MERETPPAMLCRVCHVPVDVHEFYGDEGELINFTYSHSVAVRRLDIPEHEVEPVLQREFDEIVGICDFCSEPLPAWKYPARDFSGAVNVSDIEGDHGYGSVGEWAACDACHRLIEKDDYKGLRRRALDRMPGLDTSPKALRAAIKASVTAMHEGFRAHRMGPPIHLLRTD